MALATSCLPNMVVKGPSLNNFTLCGCKSTETKLFPSEMISRKVNRLCQLALCRYSWARYAPFRKHRAFVASPSKMMVSNGYVGRDADRNKIYTRVNSCLVIPPAKGKKPHAIIKFLGGAFIGAVPEVTYSNGALLQLLTGSYFSEKIPKLGPLVSQMLPIVEASPAYSMARSASGDAWKMLLDTAGAMIQKYDQEAVTSLTKFIDQLPSVVNQVTQGMSEFKPTPSENRDCFKNSYNVQHTLLVKFNFDAIDETDLLEETLKPRVESIGGTLEKVSLGGNHLTPCIQEPKWQVDYLYSPADAIAQGLKTLQLNDTRMLARTVTDWLRHLGDK